MVELRMWMEYSEGVFLCRNIVSEHKIKLELTSAFSCDWFDRVVGLTVRLGKDKELLVGLVSPGRKDLVRKNDYSVNVLAGKPYYGHRPFYDTCLNVLVASDLESLFNRSLHHGKLIMSSLKMIMGED